MNKGGVEGKVKDVAGRIERQAWTGDPKKEVEGAAKQIEGKLQNAYGKVKDATQKQSDASKTPPKPPPRVPQSADESGEIRDSRRQDVDSPFDLFSGTALNAGSRPASSRCPSPCILPAKNHCGFPNEKVVPVFWRHVGCL